MELERMIASVPVRSVRDTVGRLLEFAAAWGGSDRVGDLSPAAPILRALVFDQILSKSPIVVEYGAHDLRLLCVYEDEALGITAENEDLPARLPHPQGDDVSWRMIAPCPDGLRKWSTEQSRSSGISKWFAVAGPDGKVSGNSRHVGETQPVGRPSFGIDPAAIERRIENKRER